MMVAPKKVASRSYGQCIFLWLPGFLWEPRKCAEDCSTETHWLNWKAPKLQSSKTAQVFPNCQEFRSQLLGTSSNAQHRVPLWCIHTGEDGSSRVKWHCKTSGRNAMKTFQVFARKLTENQQLCSGSRRFATGKSGLHKFPIWRLRLLLLGWSWTLDALISGMNKYLISYLHYIVSSWPTCWDLAKTSFGQCDQLQNPEGHGRVDQEIPDFEQLGPLKQCHF